jgi:glycosyltransferase involved in cell wall biosynthesis
MSESTPRVLFVDHTGALGGAELYLLDAARQTPNARVVLFDDGPLRTRLEASGVPTAVLPAPSAILDVRRGTGLGPLLRACPALLTLVFRLAHLARTADVVFLNSQKALIVGALAARLARRPAVWNLHDLLTADHFSGFNRRLAVFWANHFVDQVIVNSEATRTAFLESGGRTSTRLVYNGIDTAPYEAVTDEQIAVLRRELGLGSARVVGVFSRLSRWKGQHVLVEALQHVPDVHALLVGDALFGPDADYATELRTQCDALGLTDRVHFLGFRDDVPALMRLVDVVLHTSTAPEPFGRVVVEGMLARRPVIATQGGGVPEIVVDGVTGRLVPANAPAALATTLNDLFSNADATVQLASNGYDWATSAFTIEAMSQNMQRVIQDAFSSEKP